MRPIVPQVKHGEVKIYKVKDLTMQSLFDCALAIHMTHKVDFRTSLHIMLDTVIDTEFSYTQTSKLEHNSTQ